MTTVERLAKMERELGPVLDGLRRPACNRPAFDAGLFASLLQGLAKENLYEDTV